MDKIQEQVDRNYAAFTKRLPELIAEHPGKFALMKDEEIVELFDTARDALVAGEKLYGKDALFSVQQITGAAVDLGFFSHALS